MTGQEFAQYRKRLKKTQKQMAFLLGTSIKAIHSYEQGWRSIPAHAERQILFLASRQIDSENHRKMCWEIKHCSDEQKSECPAWEFQLGRLCWFINGTLCQGHAQRNWQEKMKVCRTCNVFHASLHPSPEK